jgi:hypothetical protein
MMKTVFDTPSIGIRAYLHFSYGFTFAFVTLVIREIVRMLYDGVALTFSDLLTPVNLISLLIATLAACATLYLHLPKMIVRCFTIGRKFGL